MEERKTVGKGEGEMEQKRKRIGKNGPEWFLQCEVPAVHTPQGPG